jgi:hypothetical protein
MLEQIFRVSRRRAIQLMHQFGGYQAGRTFLMDRVRLMEQLSALKSGADFLQQEHRRERLGAEMDGLRRAQAGRFVRIPVDEQVLSSRMSRLPSGVEVYSGRLLIEFCSTEDLLVKLVALSQAAAHDFDAFTAATTPTKLGSGAAASQ